MPTLALKLSSLICTGNVLASSEGYCDTDNNNPSGGYDGGDCSICTCVGNDSCQLGISDCLDPSAGDELYACEALPSTVLPCPTNGQRKWEIEDSAQARALAVAVNFLGGAFDV